MKKTLSFFVTVLYKEFSAFCNKRLQEIGLTQGLMYFIIYIDKHQKCSPGQLATNLKFDIGHTARSIDKLEQDGFVLKEKNINDKRAYLLSLTEKGVDAMNTIRNLLVDWDEIILAEIKPEERDSLLNILEKLKHRNGDEKYV